MSLVGELFIFKVPKDSLKTLILNYGGYAHGTLREHGSITLKDMNKCTNTEYALRPTFNDKCWNAMRKFRILENKL